MIWKILLTAAVIFAAFLVVRERWRGPSRRSVATSPPPPLLSAGTVRGMAYGLLGVMLLGSGWYLFSDWRAGHAVVTIQVVNANTGAITPYQARRRDLADRGFRTLDGRDIRVADVERMIVTQPGKGL